MNVTDVIFERPGPRDTSYVLRVSIIGSGLVKSGAQLVAQVGDVPVRDLVSLFGPGGVVGFLTGEPPPGAPVRVGYLGKELIDTGLAYRPASA